MLTFLMFWDMVVCVCVCGGGGGVGKCWERGSWGVGKLEGENKKKENLPNRITSTVFNVHLFENFDIHRTSIPKTL